MKYSDTERMDFISDRVINHSCLSFKRVDIGNNKPMPVEIFTTVEQHQGGKTVRGVIDLLMDIASGKKSGCINGEYGE